ncbi:unnamed protein product [Coregonus sp. 'balchen']|nr:unnamed protein product [Coregonus sp. 'balchen']
MEGVTVDNLINFDIPSCSDDTAALFAGPPSGALLHTDIFSSEPLVPEPASMVPLEPLLPEPLAPMPSSHHHCGGEDGDSDATESADSENDMDPHSQQWNSRRSSSSSNHSAEVGGEAAENQAFMKTYVEKVFHGKCYQMDDYSPAKNLMTMCFTYYHTGKSQLSPTELLQQPPLAMDSYLNKANSWLSGKKDAAERLLKNSSAAKTDVKGFFGGLESKLRASARKNEEAESPVEVKLKSPVSSVPPEKKKVENEKVYLYTHLKQQPIWGTDEEEKEEREKWCHMTQEEKDDSSKVDENIAFGQLGTFTHNMLAFGLSKKLCNDFLKKQAVIGNLNEEQYKLLSDHIEQMATE